MHVGFQVSDVQRYAEHKSPKPDTEIELRETPACAVLSRTSLGLVL